MSGEAELDAMIAGLRGMKGMAEKVAKRAAPAVQRTLQASAAAGTAPDGTPWPVRKKDGGRALANAAAAITVQAHGPVIRCTVTGPEAIHQRGTDRIPRRPTLPDDSIPDPVAEAITDAAGDVFAELAGAE